MQRTKLYLLTCLVSISSIITHNLSALGLRKGYNGMSNIKLQALLKRVYNCSLYDNNLCSIVHQHSANDKEKSMTSQPLRFVRRRRQNSIVNNSSSSQKWIVIGAVGSYGDSGDWSPPYQADQLSREAEYPVEVRAQKSSRL